MLVLAVLRVFRVSVAKTKAYALVVFRVAVDCFASDFTRRRFSLNAFAFLRVRRVSVAKSVFAVNSFSSNYQSNS